MTSPAIRSEAKILHAEPGDTGRPSAPRPQLEAELFGLSDVGRVRQSNEDQFLLASLVKSLEVSHTSLPQPKRKSSGDRTYIMMVADGVGGSAAGEEASALAVDSVETYTLEALKWFSNCAGKEDDEVLIDFRNAVGMAHQRVRSEASRNPNLRGMGTTLTLAYSVNDELYLAHVGDSRCYLFREDLLYRLTQDHSLVEEMVQRGVITREQAAHHRWRHVITNSVGGDSPDVRVDVHRLHLEAGDVIMLCSDGLSEMLSSDDIAAVLAEDAGPAATCARLIELANNAGGRDNITIAMARYTLFVDAATVELQPEGPESNYSEDTL